MDPSLTLHLLSDCLDCFDCLDSKHYFVFKLPLLLLLILLFTGSPNLLFLTDDEITSLCLAMRFVGSLYFYMFYISDSEG